MQDTILTTQLARRLYGLVQTQLIFAAVSLGIPEALAEGPRSVTALAATAGVIESRLHRVLRALASVGIFRECQPGTFELTPLAEPLRRDVPGSQRDLALFLGSPWHVQAWTSIVDTLRTGVPGFDQAHGQPLFEYLANHPDAAGSFDAAMTSASVRPAAELAVTYDFAPVTHVVDIGGGHGQLLATLLKTHTHLRGTLFERSSTALDARRFLCSQDLVNRTEVVEGDLFTDAPPAGDLLILKYVLHDWDDGAASAIMSNCRRVLPPRGRLLVIDAVMPEATPDFLTTCADLEMLILLQGHERTRREFEQLFAGSGFILSREIQLPSGLSVLEGRVDS